jgi:hypothetical protein
MNSHDFVSVEHLLSEITSTLNDTEFRNGFNKGWYISRIQDALQELSYDTFWSKTQIDTKLPEGLQLVLPENAFNVREIYLYHGETCSPGKSQVVYWKRNFNNNYDGDGYTARVKDDGSQGADIYQPNQRILRNANYNGFYGPKYYYNIINGMIMFSKNCLEYENVRVICNNRGEANGDLPVVPRFFERAVNDYVEERFYNAMKSRDPRKYRILWSDAYSRLNDNSNGSWNKARKRIKSMDTAERESMNEYVGSMMHK